MQQQQPITAGECLDVMAQLWERCTPVGAEKMTTMLTEIEHGIPGWTKRLNELAPQMTDGTRNYLYLALAWHRCRELLRRGKRL